MLCYIILAGIGTLLIHFTRVRYYMDSDYGLTDHGSLIPSIWNQSHVITTHPFYYSHAPSF